MESILSYACAFFMLLCAIFSLLHIPETLKNTLARAAWSLGLACAAAALALMLSYLVSGRFEYAYVYTHTDSSLPLLYKISALWAGQEGSLLLWAFILCASGFPVLGIRPMQGRVIALYAAVAVCVTLMCAFSHPFVRLETPADNGLGLNAALQDPWMAVHPPLVFIAYSLMAALFSFCAIPARDLDAIWSQRVRSFMLGAFVFLGLGIFTGCIWAYRALGWGGYWAWDPIENCALVPWLVLCAWLHNQKNTGRMRLVLPFVLACAGTFLARSGLLADSSLHAYAQSSTAVSVISLAIPSAALLFVFIGMFLRKKNKPAAASPFPLKQMLFFCVTVLFAALIFMATLFPLVSGCAVPVDYYNTAILVYGLLCCAWMVARQWQSFLNAFPWVFLMDTALCTLFILFFQPGGIGWVIALWALLLPFCLYILLFFRSKKKFQYALHGCIAFFFACILASCALQQEITRLFDATGGFVSIMGLNVSVSDIFSKPGLTLYGFWQDIVIHTERCIQSYNGLLLVYTVKPMVLLFFISGGLVTLLPACAFIRPHHKKNEMLLPGLDAHK